MYFGPKNVMFVSVMHCQVYKIIIILLVDE